MNISAVKDTILKIPYVGPVLRRLKQVFGAGTTFAGSQNYWEARYGEGGNSGAGSYGRLADWKAEILNTFVRDKAIRDVIEHGCGDGNQLGLVSYPSYLGIDVSETALEKCRTRFVDDESKSFQLASDLGSQQFDLALSLDVIFHLVEDDVFDAYMRRLFLSSRRWVVIYSSNHDEMTSSPHVRHRRFADWIELHARDWSLVERIDNKYPFRTQDPDNTSFCDFYVYSRSPGSQ